MDQTERCYCGLTNETSLVIPCQLCLQHFHVNCIEISKNWIHPISDPFYIYSCSRCGGKEEIYRMKIGWREGLAMAFDYLKTTALGTEDDEQLVWFHINDIERAVCSKYSQTFRLETKEGVNFGIIRCLEGDCWFERKDSSWRMKSDWVMQPGEKYELNEFGWLPVQTEVDSYADVQQVVRKRKIEDLKEFIVMYHDIDNNNYEFVTMSKQPTHTAPQVNVMTDGCTVTNTNGYRMAKASHGVYEGHWHFEVNLNNSLGAARIGWSQISGDLQAPCGYDIFSYSYRSNPGTLFHNSKQVKGPDSYLSGYKNGDVLGVSIYLPPIYRRPGDCEVSPELMKRLWNPAKMDSYMPFKTSPCEILPKSYIEYFHNGQSQGRVFENLLVGKYHPAISLFDGASATVNFGPHFAVKYGTGSRPFSKVTEVNTWDESHSAFMSIGKPTPPIIASPKVDSAPPFAYPTEPVSIKEKVDTEMTADLI